MRLSHTLGSIRLHKAPACALRASLCSPSPTHRGQLDTRAFSAKRKIELLVARFLRAGGSRRKSWNDARCCSGGERLAIGTMYPGGIPGPGLIFEAWRAGRLFDGLGWPGLPRLASGSADQPMWRKLIARYLLLARAILPLLRHTRGAARGRRKSPRRLLGPGSAAFSPFYCDKNPDGERPAFWETGFFCRGAGRWRHCCALRSRCLV